MAKLPDRIQIFNRKVLFGKKQSDDKKWPRLVPEKDASTADYQVIIDLLAFAGKACRKGRTIDTKSKIECKISFFKFYYWNNFLIVNTLNKGVAV